MTSKRQVAGAEHRAACEQLVDRGIVVAQYAGLRLKIGSFIAPPWFPGRRSSRTHRSCFIRGRKLSPNPSGYPSFTAYASTGCLWRLLSLPGQSGPSSASVFARGAVGTNAAARGANRSGNTGEEAAARVIKMVPDKPMFFKPFPGPLTPIRSAPMTRRGGGRIVLTLAQLAISVIALTCCGTSGM
jgi:hypothetical protein